MDGKSQFGYSDDISRHSDYSSSAVTVECVERLRARKLAQGAIITLLPSGRMAVMSLSAWRFG